MDEEVMKYAHAKLVGVQFGLLSSSEIVKISVFSKMGESDLAARKRLTDSRLGLPNIDNECRSCGERVTQKCEGHFGHLWFPCKIYHPNYVHQIVKILDNLCLHCYSLKSTKKKKKPRDVHSVDEMIDGMASIHSDEGRNSDGTKMENACSDSFSPRASTLKPPLRPEEEREGLNQRMSPNGFSTTSTMGVANGRVVIDLLSDDDNDGEPFINNECTPDDKSPKGKSAIPSKEASSSKRKTATRKKSVKDGGGGRKPACKFCKLGEYPKMHVKLERIDKKSNKNVAEKICLELEDDEDGTLDDYLERLGKGAEDFDGDKLYLLPEQVFKILAELSDAVVQHLKMDTTVCRPEALVLESLLIPPNCNRVPERPGVDQMRFGSDKVTQSLARILGKLPAMKASKATSMTRRVAIEEMQCLVGHYLRLKGAPKVRGSNEPSVDHVRPGKATKPRTKVSLNNLQQHVAAKVSSFCCRAVLTGDSFLRLDEIGIPLDIAKGITVCEAVTKENQERMQEIVNNGPKSYAKTGALYYSRGGIKKDLNHCSDVVTIAVGDTIGRHLQDGDYVFCNRPPSLHKYSLLGLRARVLDIPTIAINPLICFPLGADFDGDCLAVFVPQSMECKAEVKELMMVQKQTVTSHGGQCTFKLTQDALLAAHKLTNSFIFLTKPMMEHGCMCTGSLIPTPAIVKSPKGSFWTSTQFFQLSLPAGVEYNRDCVLISDSEILMTNGKPDWLGSSRDSLLHTIVQQHGGDAAIEYLGSCGLMLVHWLSQLGFTVGPLDAHAAADSRASMVEEISRSLEEKEKLVDEKLQRLSGQLGRPSKSQLQRRSMDSGVTNGLSMYARTLEKLGIQYMQIMLSEVEDDALKHICTDNSMLQMVRAGSKGSIKKFVEQFGFLGMQLYRGKYMHPLKNAPSRQLGTVQGTMARGERWEQGGLAKSSFVDGLTPHEFFIHTVSYRDAMIRQALRVSEPGYLSKNMMLFVRDIYVDYDGTVRNHHGKHLIQFQYGGLKEGDESPYSSAPRWADTILAGEPVGILAATAITQPAMQMLLESPNQLNDLAVCPLELLQETLYSRKTSVMKHLDQRVVLFLSEAHGHSKEGAAMKVQQLLQHVTLEMLVSSISINFRGAMNGGAWEGLLPANRSPWIVHLSLHKLAVDTWGASVQQVVEKLKSSREVCEFGALSFVSREQCDALCPGFTGSEWDPCVSFCITNAQSPSIEESLSRMRNQILPRVMKASIMGDRSIQSVSIVPSEVCSEPWVPTRASSPTQNEVVIEVIVARSCVKKKHDAWLLVQELCGPVLDLIDWSQSIPSSIQGVASIYGIEAAHSCIYQRLKSVLRMFDKTVYTQHILLMSDLMTHSGNVIGLNAAGFREFINTLHISAPMTQSLFQNSIKHIQTAALKGKWDNLSGTLPSICWGKPASVGTGANFELLWQSEVG